MESEMTTSQDPPRGGGGRVVCVIAFMARYHGFISLPPRQRPHRLAAQLARCVQMRSSATQAMIQQCHLTHPASWAAKR